MLLFQKFYNADEKEAGGNAPAPEVVEPKDTVGSENPSPSENTSESAEATKEVAPQSNDLPEDVKQQLAELEELRAFKKAIVEKEPEKTPEQLAKETQIEKANLRKFAIENDLMTDDDFNQFEAYKTKANRDLVFEKFYKERIEDNEALGDDKLEGEELEAAIKEDFEQEYKLNSTNEKTKARGEVRLEKEANELRNPYESKYKTAQERYNEEREMRAKYPPFDNFVEQQIKELTPDKLPLFSTKDDEEDIAIDVELTAADREAIGKTFKNPKNFARFMKSGDNLEELKNVLQKKINGYIREHKFDEVGKKIFTTAKGIGIRKGSNIGAEQPFALTQSTKQVAPVISLEESNRRMAEIREKYGR